MNTARRRYAALCASICITFSCSTGCIHPSGNICIYGVCVLVEFVSVLVYKHARRDDIHTLDKYSIYTHLRKSYRERSQATTPPHVLRGFCSQSPRSHVNHVSCAFHFGRLFGFEVQRVNAALPSFKMYITYYPIVYEYIF